MSLDDREQLPFVESFTTEQEQFSENRRHKWM